MQTAIFCDFDGTIARRDVGYTMFNHFSGGENDKLIPDWKAGRLSTRDCLLLESQMVTIKDGELEPFLDQFEIDPDFTAFVEMCAAQKIDLTVISDGLDFYITHILRRFDLDHLPVISNVGEVKGGKVEVRFPYDVSPHDGCGVCKGARIREYRRTNSDVSTIVYVGDGYSDKCAAEETDVLFAKKDLQRYCDERQIAYHSFDTFDDVTRGLQKLKLVSLGT